MKAKNNTKTIAIALIFAFAASMIALPSIDAAITEYETHIYVSPTPVIGVGQVMSIVYFTDQMAMPSDIDSTLGALSGRETWVGITLTITTPNGTKETIAAGPTDPVGAGYIAYVPTEIGKYMSKPTSRQHGRIGLHQSHMDIVGIRHCLLEATISRLLTARMPRLPFNRNQ